MLSSWLQKLVHLMVLLGFAAALVFFGLVQLLVLVNSHC